MTGLGPRSLYYPISEERYENGDYNHLNLRPFKQFIQDNWVKRPAHSYSQRSLVRERLMVPSCFACPHLTNKIK